MNGTVAVDHNFGTTLHGLREPRRVDKMVRHETFYLRGASVRALLTGTSVLAVTVAAFLGAVRVVGGRGVIPFDEERQRPSSAEPDVRERFIPLDGTYNTRDLGGYVVPGGRVRPGMFYRSGHLSRLTDRDVQHLERLGIRTIVDLREPARANRYPNRPIAGATPVRLPIYDSIKPLHLTLLLNRRAISRSFRDFYIEYLEAWSHRLAPVFRLLADEASYPVLIHCTNGKDRVGVTVALVLELLGVPRATVIDDYLLSNAYLDEVLEAFIEHEEGRLLLRLGIPRDELRILMGVEREWIVAALEHVDRKYGSVERYLVERMGLDPSDLDAIRTILGEPS